MIVGKWVYQLLVYGVLSFCLPSVALAQAVFSNEKLTVTFERTPIREVLIQVAGATGITILFDPEVHELLSMKFDAVPLETALRRLLRRQSHSFVYTQESLDLFKVSQIKVFREGQQSEARFEVLEGGEPVKEEGTVAAQAVEETKNGKAVAIPEEKGRVEGVGETAEVVGDAVVGGVVNPRGVGASARILQAMAATQQEIAMIQHKSEAEQQALQRSGSQVQRALSLGQGSPPVLLDEIIKEKDQQNRLEQTNAQQMVQTQKKMRELSDQLARTTSPAELQKKDKIRKIRQAGLQQRRNSNQQSAM